MTVLSLSFILSLAGVVSVFTMKHWGIGSENTLYKKVREYLDQRTIVLFKVLQRVPYVSQVVFFQVSRRFLYELSKLALYLVRFIERRLHKFVNMVKGKGSTNNQKGSASIFLKSIKERSGVHEGKDR